MCDENTLADSDRAQARQNLGRQGYSRRGFATIGAVAAAVAIGGGAQAAVAKHTRALTERMVRIDTPDGVADAFFAHPAKGTFPGIVLWPDIAGPRETFRATARRFAQAGYAVLVVNQYYRSAPAPVLDSFAAWRTPEGQAKLKPMIAAITPAATTRDASAFVAFLDGQAVVDKARRIGTCGYCMGGPFTVRTAAAAPTRVGAAASLHGAKLASDDADSPDKLIAGTQASYLFAIGRNDDAREPEVKDKLRAACAAARRPAEIEVYSADHGWCVDDTPMYDATAAAHVESRMLALFAKL